MTSSHDSFGRNSNDPVGLEVLADLDHLIFKQKVTHYDDGSGQYLLSVECHSLLSVILCKYV